MQISSGNERRVRRNKMNLCGQVDNIRWSTSLVVNNHVSKQLCRLVVLLCDFFCRCAQSPFHFKVATEKIHLGVRVIPTPVLSDNGMPHSSSASRFDYLLTTSGKCGTAAFKMLYTKGEH